jgi:hypothetical protein
MEEERLITTKIEKYYIPKQYDSQKIMEMKNVLISNGFEMDYIDQLPFHQFEELYKNRIKK